MVGPKDILLVLTLVIFTNTNEHHDYSYYVSAPNDLLPFSEALYSCQKKGMQLLESEHDNVKNVSQYFFTYYSGKHTEYWVLNKALYMENHGDQSDHRAVCEKIKIRGHMWYKSLDYCMKAKRYVCKRHQSKKAGIEGFLGVVSKRMNFLEAATACSNLNRQLAYIKNVQENKQMTKQVAQELGSQEETYWIGGIHIYTYPGYKWYPSSKPIIYDNIERPTKESERIHCLAFKFRPGEESASWIQVSCNLKLKFLCRAPFEMHPKHEWIANPEMHEHFHHKQEKNVPWVATRSLFPQNYFNDFNRFMHGLIYGKS